MLSSTFPRRMTACTPIVAVRLFLWMNRRWQWLPGLTSTVSRQAAAPIRSQPRTVRYIPLKTAEHTLGVLGVKPKDEITHLTPDQRRLLEAFASQAALAIEHVQLAEQAQNAELLQATEKLQTALLNSISHDLRTPLVSITGALTSLQDSNVVLQDDIVISLIETAREEADRLNRLVGNLLSMTRLEGGAMNVVFSPGDVQDAIGAALEQLKDRLSNSPGNRQVKITVPEDFPLVPMDFALIVQVLVNVIDNAIKYSPAGSTIEIGAQVSGSWANITVADQGIGIPADDLTRIFDKFYRVQRPESVTGTGLGLAICKGIVDAHHGRIAASNRRCRWSAHHHLSPPGKSLVSGDQMSGTGQHVLVVDDEFAIRRFLRVALNAQGYVVAEAGNGWEALNAVVAQRPDIIILDLGLPDMDGVEVTRRLREWTQVPVIILSVREQENDKISALDAGADDYLTKPFSSGELMARLRVALRRSAMPSEEPILQLDGLLVDFSRRIVTIDGQEVSLTPTEYELLRLLVQNAGKVLTHRQLLRQVWGPGYEPDQHLLRVNISNLRRKIEPDPARPRYIITEPGVGYRLRVSV